MYSCARAALAQLHFPAGNMVSSLYGMPIELTRELTAALRTAADGELEVVDPESRRSYYIVDGATHRRAMAALNSADDRAAIAEGIRQMLAGETRPIDDVFDDLLDRLHGTDRG